ncbi:sporulation domain-containing protein [Rubrobacter tropicus]|uniref:Sporulation domain-containing protein n=1 Tax=Rubrobacter tropicus TaxID=2653851 RepID=A0A6G8QCS3_9ACTN|nr:phosphodiester glycosidase family protein [Rubrobacter tropicus]QIN84300.1 sporulation domain-containing protein [Rubrobacter tropicus]
MKLQKGLLCVLAALILGTLGLTSALAAAPNGPAYRDELPLGNPGLKETRTTEQVAPGVTYTRVVRGEESRKDFYTVDVAFEAGRAAAGDVADQLRADGYKARVERVSDRAPDDPAGGPSGYLVRAGRFATQAGADAFGARLTADGYAGTRTVYTGEDGGKTTGPWVVHVLKVDPGLYDGTLAPELATEVVPERELLTGISARTGALAAVNGGYFVIGPNDGTPRDLAGISVLGGGAVSEAVDGRTSLVLPEGDGAGSDVAALSDSYLAASSDGASLPVDGLNRKPGLIRGCGGEGGDNPTEEPKHDFTCTDSSELILFTPLFGANTEPGEGAEAVLDPSGRVTELREGRGGPIPPGGSVLSGTGAGAGWLRAHAAPGATVSVKTTISGEGARLDEGTGVVNGGPRLLRGGEEDITAFAEGFVYPENPEFYYRFGERRNPRTLAGTTPGGDLLLVAVDGRRPGYSVGASFEEGAGIMGALGSDEAVNLDGGGSTGMTVRQGLVTRPSDTTGERPIGDAVVVLP